MKREQLLAHTRALLWQAWTTSSEDLASQAAATLTDLGMLVPEGGAAELDRLRMLLDAQPAHLSDEQLQALDEAGNRAANDAAHERQCACTSWPEACASGYYATAWDSDMTAALPAVIGLWESMRTAASSRVLAPHTTTVHLENQ